MTTQTTHPSHVKQAESTELSTCDWCGGLIWSTYWIVRLGSWDQVCRACGGKHGWTPVAKEEEYRFTW